MQVINLVSAGTIEEQMLDKLRFKSAMFEGVLDNGQNTIFLGEGSKFTQMMDTLGEMVEETEKPSEPAATEIITESATTESVITEPSTEECITETEAPREDSLDSSTSSTQSESETPQPQPLTTPKNLIAQGTAFLSGLAETLKSPEATEQLINSLVETDPETGQTSLKISVPDKQTVRNLLDIVSKLFG